MESARVHSNRWERAADRATGGEPRYIRRLFETYGSPDPFAMVLRELSQQYVLNRKESDALGVYIKALEKEVYRMYETSKRGDKNSENLETTPCKADAISLHVTVTIDGKTASVLDWILSDWPRFDHAQVRNKRCACGTFW